ncbi:hypothetical protein LC612_24700 [Nostoc sp. CHAB 5834]|nr:hypothetical protein [Nostoc sp. CHAB 5834]
MGKRLTKSITVQIFPASCPVLPELPADASDAQRYIHSSRHNPKKILISLLEGRSDFDDIDALAKANPKYFLDAIWPWVTDLISKIIDQEELVKNTYNEKNDNYPTIAQTVGAPMNVKEMSCASDQHLLNLFNELSDMTETDYFTGKGDLSRAGGESSQAYEFGKLIKDNPERFFRILPQLEPQHHGRYAGNAIRELVENGFPTNNLIELVENLEQRGFISEEFRSDTASALEKISERNQGLPKSILSQLENWLLTHPKPELKDYRSKEEETSHQLQSSIVFNTTTSHILPSGRGSIVRAIAAGYLEQNPPDLQNWARVIKSRLEIEPHPAVWVDILAQMPPLLNGDRTQATQLFDAVIRNCPEVLRYRWALYFLSRTVGWFEPKETVQGWLEMLWADGSNFCRQAYGELLFIHYFQYQDEWSVVKIDHHLANQNDEAVLCGLAHVASHLWIQRRCRTKAAEILYNLAPSNIEAIRYPNIF